MDYSLRQSPTPTKSEVGDPTVADWAICSRAAIIAPGLHLAFKNNQAVMLAGQIIDGETVSHESI